MGNHRAIETSRRELAVQVEPIESTGHGWAEGFVSLREWGKFPGGFLLTVAECYSTRNYTRENGCLGSVTTKTEDRGDVGRATRNGSADTRELLA